MSIYDYLLERKPVRDPYAFERAAGETFVSGIQKKIAEAEEDKKLLKATVYKTLSEQYVPKYYEMKQGELTGNKQIDNALTIFNKILKPRQQEERQLTPYQRESIRLRELSLQMARKRDQQGLAREDIQRLKEEKSTLFTMEQRLLNEFKSGGIPVPELWAESPNISEQEQALWGWKYRDLVDIRNNINNLENIISSGGNLPYKESKPKKETVLQQTITAEQRFNQLVKQGKSETDAYKILAQEGY